jgi:hypothetical protein
MRELSIPNTEKVGSSSDQANFWIVEADEARTSLAQPRESSSYP